MASGGKRFGGVKRRQGKSSAAADSAPKRTFGGVKAVPRGTAIGSGHMESCPENCPGEYIERMWIHSRNCPWASVLWKGHGKTEKDWACPYDCDPIELPSGWTHPFDCPFWDRTGRTPFDHNAPAEAERVTTQSNRNRRGKRNSPTADINAVARQVYDFTDIPKPLRESGDDLPF